MSQEGALNYLKVDLSWPTGKETASGKTCQQTISQGQSYTVLSCAKSWQGFVITSSLWTN